MTAISFAQASDLRVEVLDRSWAVIMDAQVILRHAGSKEHIQIARTDQIGRCTFSNIEPGLYEIEISSPGFSIHREPVRVGTADSQISLLLEVAPIAPCEDESPAAPMVRIEQAAGQSTELAGTVEEPQQILLTGVRISLQAIGRRSRPIETQTDGNGLFLFRDLKPGSYRLRAVRPGYSDFIIDSIEVKAAHCTLIQDPLEMLRCPTGMRCEPNRKVHRLAVCL